VLFSKILLLNIFGPITCDVRKEGLRPDFKLAAFEVKTTPFPTPLKAVDAETSAASTTTRIIFARALILWSRFRVPFLGTSFFAAAYLTAL
jgi:hypothetical protein